MVPQYDFRGANANMFGNSPPKSFSRRLKIVEKRGDELKQFFALRREREWPPLKERRAERLLQLNDLPAHGRLLNAVGHVAHSLADASMFADVIKQFEVMDVHGISLFDARL